AAGGARRKGDGERPVAAAAARGVAGDLAWAACLGTGRALPLGRHLPRAGLLLLYGSGAPGAARSAPASTRGVLQPPHEGVHPAVRGGATGSVAGSDADGVPPEHL